MKKKQRRISKSQPIHSSVVHLAAVAHITENDAKLEMVGAHVIAQFIPLIISLIISLAQI